MFKNSLGSLDFNNVTVIPDENHYDSENLKNVNVNYITEPKIMLQVDFNDLKSLNNINEDGVKNEFTINCKSDGTIDGLVAWFELNLDEEISLYSSKEESSWQLAIFSSDSFKVKTDDNIKITTVIFEGIPKCFCNKINQETDTNNDNVFYHLPRDVITFLNDKLYVDALIEYALEKKEEDITTVLDNGPFPIYGLTLLKENVNCKFLFCETKNKELQNFIKHLIIKNNIDGEVHFISDPFQLDFIFDNVYVHNFDSKGELQDLGGNSFKRIYRFVKKKKLKNKLISVILKNFFFC